MRPRFLALFFCVFLACSREEKRPERTEPWLSPSAAPSVSGRSGLGRAHYEIEKSDIAFELPAKRSNPHGRLPAATGRFEIDLDHPERSTGSVRVDLTLLELDSGTGATDAAGADRERALEWLELGKEIPLAEREARRFATFFVSGIEGVEGRSLANVRERRDGKRPELGGVAVGELALHGVRAPARVPVGLEIDAGQKPLGGPERLVIRSRRPLVVSLGVHDIKPRDARGVLVARELALLGENVGREAKVTFELTLALRP